MRIKMFICILGKLLTSFEDILGKTVISITSSFGRHLIEFTYIHLHTVYFPIADLLK